jgi:hypothetical protein
MANESRRVYYEMHLAISVFHEPIEARNGIPTVTVLSKSNMLCPFKHHFANTKKFKSLYCIFVYLNQSSKCEDTILAIPEWNTSGKAAVVT